ncbi:MAG TPA: radical SAM protein, partial [Euryarchaeota archaeon]|nr:radical SAM protein [Euryarchaeota archaeon]
MKNVLIVDGYTDEPSMFGVPPYISPYVRYIYGAVLDAGGNPRYITIDKFRELTDQEKEKTLTWSDITVIHRGVIVPGKYMGGSPIKFNEIISIASKSRGLVVLGGSVASYGFGGIGGKRPIPPSEVKNYVDYLVAEDVDAFVYDLIKYGKASQRYRSKEEWFVWAIKGAKLVKEHDWYPHVICEIE